ncbi:MAG: TIGR04282 family arsenosugar biosynthesis glycosyltransferase [Deltaproteobacteria bacterium]|nr:TIGR04282 family arsenosugar biosynthesis glycosyltransferase [Deltaproteobacteria bacterium]
MSRNALIVFAREPVPGQVKTRLAASVGDIAAADKYASMLENVLSNCRKLTGVETTVFWDCNEASLPLLERRYECRSKLQGVGKLGQRMQAAFAEIFGSGCDHCCIIGSDSPDLPVSYILEAFDRLTSPQTDAVFGPTHDGGYYLLGLSRLWPQLFENIDWSTPQTLLQSLDAAGKAGIRAALLPKWYDIDTLDDLEEYRARTGAKSGMLRVSEEL